MGRRSSRSEDHLLALALASRADDRERRMLPDRRSGVDRRRMTVNVLVDRRCGAERRCELRRRADREEGATLLEKARIALTTLKSHSGKR
jgi:hypothetical protein